MKPDELEKRLQDLPLRPPPVAWRAEILAEAQRRATSTNTASTNTTTTDLRATLPAALAPAPSSSPSPSFFRWREWLWPCPHAWAGLAAAWILIAMLRLVPGENFATNPAPFAGTATPRSTSPVRDGSQGMTAQRRELVRLLENTPEVSPAPKRNPSGPRSDLPLPPRA
jgi:hypothetical protein